MPKEKKTKLTTRAALDKLQKEVKESIREIQKLKSFIVNNLILGKNDKFELPDGWTLSDEDLKPSKSGELEKQEEDIWFVGNYYTDRRCGGLFYHLRDAIVKCIVNPLGDMSSWHRGEYTLKKSFKKDLIQAPDSMILDYLMKGYREKGWKEG